MRKAAVLLLAAIAFAGQAVAADFETAILNAHNAARRAVGVADLAWSDALAAGAAAWARHLATLGRLEHSPSDVRGGAGENLWMGTAGGYTTAQMVAGWTDERRDFRPGTFPDVARDGQWTAVGHYTQMIWRGTTEVGCAVASSRQWDVLVCRYAPAGNMVGETVY